MIRIVDSHAHIMLRSYGTLKPAEPEALVRDFARRGVDRVWYSSIDALAGNQTDLHRRCNDRMAELQQQFGDAFVGLATVNPRDGDQAARELERAVMQLGLKGWKFHGWLQPVSCCDPCLEPLFEAAGELRLVVLFHDGTPPFASSLQIGHLAERYPRCSMILGHGGLKDLAENAVQAVLRHPNVYMQTCGGTSLALRRAVERVGPEKILYGSDGGFGDPGLIDYNIRKIREWSLPSDQEAMIFAGNADRLLEKKT